MNTFEDTDMSQTEDSLPIVRPTFWQSVVERFRRARPMISDIRGEQLYQSQVDLLDAEAKAENHRYHLMQAEGRISLLKQRIGRLSGDTLPRPYDLSLQRYWQRNLEGVAESLEKQKRIVEQPAGYGEVFRKD